MCAQIVSAVAGSVSFAQTTVTVPGSGQAVVSVTISAATGFGSDAGACCCEFGQRFAGTSSRATCACVSLRKRLRVPANPRSCGKSGTIETIKPCVMTDARHVCVHYHLHCRDVVRRPTGLYGGFIRFSGGGQTFTVPYMGFSGCVTWGSSRLSLLWQAEWSVTRRTAHLARMLFQVMARGRSPRRCRHSLLDHITSAWYAPVLHPQRLSSDRALPACL